MGTSAVLLLLTMTTCLVRPGTGVDVYSSGCPRLSDPACGTVSVSYDGLRATYSCSSWCELEGNKLRTCVYNVWSGSQPTCVKRCRSPGNPAHGTVSVSGDTATYRCRYGYKLQGSKTRTCTYGSWRPSKPSCVKLCPTLNDPSYGTVDVSYNTATYTCNSGYRLKGNRRRTCTKGVWSGSQPSCVKLCPSLSNPNYGTVDVSYSTATYSCNKGYKLHGNEQRTCSYGTWTGSQPSCVKLCPEPSNPSHGTVSVSGDTASYRCNYGYELHGAKKRTCTYGVWKPSEPSCVKLCPSLNDPSYGSVHVSHNTATYFCNSGYMLEGNAWRICKSGVWSGRQPSCEKLCPSLSNPRYGTVDVSYDTATYSCKEGYRLHGNEQRNCTYGTWNGTWTGSKPSCVKICPQLTNPSQGTVTVTATVTGKAAKYQCNYGYKLVGNKHRVCIYGTWIGSQPSCVKLCPELSNPSYGTVTVTDDTAKYQCKYGYKLVGNKQRTCNYGTWTGSQPSCVKLCPDLSNPSYGTVTVTGYAAKYQCNYGYRLVGSSRRVCINGVWSGSQPSCVKLCPELSSPQYGSVSASYNTATYTCNKGYKLHGDNRRTCQNGVWSGSKPSCVKVCPWLVSPPNGRVSVSGNAARYQCNDGYLLRGNRERTCRYGVWSGSEPSCIKKVCPKLTHPLYGSVSVSYNTATYTCNYGYELRGNKQRTCQYGVWSGSKPSCVKVCPDLVNPAYGTVAVLGNTATYQCKYGYTLSGNAVRKCIRGYWSGSQPSCVKLCPVLRDPSYGSVSVSGNTATYTCSYGYNLQGHKKRTCSYGVWSGSQPSCMKECPALSSPSYGAVHVTGNIATYTCTYGYDLQGFNRRVCTNGVWSGNQPSCVQGCESLTDPRNGRVVVAGSQASYFCDSGYGLNGNGRRTCSYGRWSGDAPVCVRDGVYIQ